MALSPSTAASEIEAAYRDFVGIDEDGMPTGDLSAGDFAQAFATAYDDYAADGEVPGAASGGGDASIISSFMNSVPGSDPATVGEFAQAMADYWAGVAVEPGEPAHGGGAVVAVENDALSRVSEFEDAISDSITTELSEPLYLDLVENLQGAVESIVWTITEQMPNGSTQQFPEGIS